MKKKETRKANDKRETAALAAALLCVLILIGCGTPSGGGGPGSAPKAGKEPEIVADFDYTDIIGNWYGISESGFHLLRIKEVENPNAPSKFSPLVLYTLGGAPSTGNIGGLQIIPQILPKTDAGLPLIFGAIEAEERCDEKGNPIAYCVFRLQEWGYGRADLYDDGSLHAVKLRTHNKSNADDGSNEPLYDTSELAVFRREFPPSSEVNRENGVISGIWHACHEEEDVILIAYPEGTFCLYQEEIPATGIYQIEGNTVSFTCQMADGEPYTDNDAVVVLPLLEDNSFDLGEVVMPLVTGKQSGSWICDSEEETGSSGIVFQLELKGNGGFALRQIWNGEIREAVGLCLYRSDTEADLLYCFDDGGAHFILRERITLEADGSITMNYKNRVSHFRKE